VLADAGSIPAASTNHRSVNDQLRPLKPLVHRGLRPFLQNHLLVIHSLFRAWFGHNLGTSCFLLSCRQRRQEPKQGQDVRQTSFYTYHANYYYSGIQAAVGSLCRVIIVVTRSVQTYSGHPERPFCGVNLYNPAKVSPMRHSQVTVNQISDL